MTRPRAVDRLARVLAFRLSGRAVDRLARVLAFRLSGRALHRARITDAALTSGVL